MLRTPSPPAPQRGLSLVELMVGIAVGLIVVAAASLVLVGQLGDNRRLLLETQVQQDLRATADIITRELRRSGSTNVAQQMVWHPGSAGAQPNVHAALTPASGAAGETTFSYRRGPGAEGPYGFRLEDGKIRTLLAAGGWQDLTDPATMRVTAFSVTPVNGPAEQLPCPKPCAGGGTACWPSVTVRELEIVIAAQALADPSVQRSIVSRVRLRNDWVQFNDPANPNAFCPS